MKIEGAITLAALGRSARFTSASNRQRESAPVVLYWFVGRCGDDESGQSRLSGRAFVAVV
jgi:hypothetical protein